MLYPRRSALAVFPSPREGRQKEFESYLALDFCDFSALQTLYPGGSAPAVLPSPRVGQQEEFES